MRGRRCLFAHLPGHAIMGIMRAKDTEEVAGMLSAIYFAVDVVLGYLVYQDAQKNYNEHALLWGLGTFFFPIVAIVYILVGRKR